METIVNQKSDTPADSDTGRFEPPVACACRRAQVGKTLETSASSGAELLAAVLLAQALLELTAQAIDGGHDVETGAALYYCADEQPRVERPGLARDVRVQIVRAARANLPTPSSGQPTDPEAVNQELHRRRRGLAPAGVRHSTVLPQVLRHAAERIQSAQWDSALEGGGNHV